MVVRNAIIVCVVLVSMSLEHASGMSLDNAVARWRRIVHGNGTADEK